MNELYDVCPQVPVTGGVLPGDYIDAFINYASSRGYSFNYNATLKSLNTYSGFCNSIKNGIDIDAPVGLYITNTLNFVSDDGLIIGDQSENSYFAWHWVTITRYNYTNPSVPIVTLSSWGAKYDMNLQILYDTRGEMETVYFYNSAFSNAYRKLSVGEHIIAINSVPGIWQIVEGTKLLWCNAGPTSYYGSSSEWPIELVVDAVEPAWLSPILYNLDTEQQFTAYSAVPGWWYVKWGTNYGWVNAGPTSYVGQSSTFPMTLSADISGLPIFKDKPY